MLLVKDGLSSAVPPCFRGWTLLSTEYQHIPGNWRMPTRRRILGLPAFDCALSGPFNELRRPALSIPVLCTCTSSFLLPPQWFHGRCSVDGCMIHRIM